ncbi:MAG: phosphatidylserine decarboxylase [Desulfobacteraceae bacterium 4572_19]|nr:MAG: phosphatidylserine decarboxylase [Desulfobacteraceae bacterium 4572_19]
MNEFSWSDHPSQTAFPIARPGYFIIFVSAFVTTIFALCDMELIAIVALLITLFICAFFRDPDRAVPVEENAVVSPADGKIIKADIVEDTSYLNGQCLKISIFMSVFNVHVNRVPHEGVVKKVIYFPGKFFNASFDKASTENERNAIIVETKGGQQYAFVQIAGLIARRIISRLQINDTIVRGRRFGMICFGSRLDVYLPVGTKLNVSMGDKVSAGTTILGYLSEVKQAEVNLAGANLA